MEDEIKEKLLKEIIKFGKYCNGLSPHNAEGFGFEISCKNFVELQIFPLIEETSKAKDEEFNKILDLCEAQEIISQIQNYEIKQRIKEE